MNKIFNLLALALFATVTLTSCTQDKDDDNTPGTLPDTTVTSYTISMGAQASSNTYNIHDVDSNGTYNISYFNAHKSIIDLVYYYAESGGDGYCISSPNNNSLLSVTAYSSYINSSDIASANNTQIKKVSSLSTSQFDKVIDGAEVKDIYDGAGNISNNATNINAGSILAVKLSTGKHGIIKVNAIVNSGSVSDISLSMKVQQ
ncbi:MAG: hypothetical protein IPJ79_13080 [Bacteroidetes bacterium]|nr:hypothetical protein [Bacteroidota bacterium]